MQDQLWVEPVSNLIIARMRGMPTEALLRECQERVLQLIKDTGCNKVLYDALEMEPPHADVVLSQQKLDSENKDVKMLRAIIVPNTKLAYLARIAFGEGDYRVFYNDMVAAVRWLDSSDPCRHNYANVQQRAMTGTQTGNIILLYAMLNS